MAYIDERGAAVLAGTAGASAPVIYVIDLPEHPFDIATAARRCAATVLRIPVRAWGESLTPWPAPGVHPGDPAFAGGAATTLAELTEEVAPALEARFGLAPMRRAICGYSLGGLFALYAFARDARIAACACLSGSVWYEGWMDYFSAAPIAGAGRYVYFSLGKKECKAGPCIMRAVQDNMEACAAICRARGCAVDVVLGPGSHMQHHTERFAAGLAALDAFLAA